MQSKHFGSFCVYSYHKKLLPVIQKENIKLLIFANKHDIASDVSLSSIIETFELDKISNFEIVEISAKTGYGMTDAFIRFYSILTGQTIKKNSVAKSISIYNNQGTPLTVQLKDDDDIKSTQFEGGFLSAITAFAETKIHNSCVKFQSEENVTFLILKTENFIGALLWNDALEIPIDVSEEALQELLDHLESSKVYQAPESVPLMVEQYCTNIL